MDVEELIKSVAKLSVQNVDVNTNSEQVKPDISCLALKNYAHSQVAQVSDNSQNNSDGRFSEI